DACEDVAMNEHAACGREGDLLRRGELAGVALAFSGVIRALAQQAAKDSASAPDRLRRVMKVHDWRGHLAVVLADAVEEQREEMGVEAYIVVYQQDELGTGIERCGYALVVRCGYAF